MLASIHVISIHDRRLANVFGTNDLNFFGFGVNFCTLNINSIIFFSPVGPDSRVIRECASNISEVWIYPIVLSYVSSFLNNFRFELHAMTDIMVTLLVRQFANVILAIVMVPNILTKWQSKFRSLYPLSSSS